MPYISYMFSMLVPTFDGSTGCGVTVLIIGFEILVLNTWLEASSEWNGSELSSSVLEVDKTGVFFVNLLGLCVDGKIDNIPVGLAVKGRDNNADVSGNDNDNDDEDDDEDCVGSDVVEDADGKGELVTAVDCTTDLVLE